MDGGSCRKGVFLYLAHFIAQFMHKGLERLHRVGTTGAEFNQGLTTTKDSVQCVEARQDIYFKDGDTSLPKTGSWLVADPHRVQP